MRKGWLVAALIATAPGAALATGLEIDIAGEADGTIVIDLFEDVAPLHVERIVTLTGEGRCFAAYREVGGEFAIERLIFEDTATLSRGRWAISRIALDGLESRGVVVEIDEGDPPPPDGAACTHSFGGRYAHTACSASYQCCDGTWRMLPAGCGDCRCVEESGATGCE